MRATFLAGDAARFARACNVEGGVSPPLWVAARNDDAAAGSTTVAATTLARERVSRSEMVSSALGEVRSTPEALPEPGLAMLRDIAAAKRSGRASPLISP